MQLLILTEPQPRRLKEDITEGGFLFPAGEQLLIPLPYLGYTEAGFWSAGEHDAEFRPERFLETSDELPGFMPWGYGAKTCPGQALASAEGKAMLYLPTLGGWRIDLKNLEEEWRVHGITSTPAGGACEISQR